MPYRLTYFASRGRGEQIRLLLNELGQQYEETFVKRKSFVALKKQGVGVLAFGSIPLLEDDGFRLVQAPVILSYLARKHGIAPSDLHNASRADAIAWGAEDLRMRYFKLFGEGAEEKQAEYVGGIWKSRWLPNLEALLELNGNTGFFVGASLTHADIAMWDAIDANVEYVSGATLDGFPGLQAFYASVGERPRIAAYLSSDRRIK